MPRSKRGQPMSKVDRDSLLGSWKLISIQFKASDNGEVIDLYGPDPIGFCLFDPGGRMMVVITPSGKREVPGFVGGYSGKYRIEDNVLVTRFDVAIHPSQFETAAFPFSRLAVIAVPGCTAK